MNHEPFDRDMSHHFRYHRKVIRLCRVIAAIHVDGKVFNRIAPKDLRGLKDNQQIRWKLEDRLRELLRRNGDFPLTAKGRPHE